MNRFFTQICTHLFYDWSAVIWQTPDLEFLNTQAGYIPAAAATPLHLSIWSNTIKEMVRNPCILKTWQFFHSPFLQINCHFWGECLINDIAAHRLMFAPSPLLPSFVYEKRAGRQKEWWENIVPWQFCRSFTHLFSIKLPFLGQTCMINAISAHRPMFLPSPLPPACIYENRVGRQKEWWENIALVNNFTVLLPTLVQ